MANKTGVLKYDLTVALGASQRELAEILGVSRRTVQRLDKNLWGLGSDARRRAAIAVFPKDPELAAQLASDAHTTLEQLGLVRPAAPPAKVAGPQVSPPKPQPLPASADSVVCAAADAMNLPPRAVRPALLAAFKRAQALGLSVEAMRAWLETEEQPEPKSRSKS